MKELKYCKRCKVEVMPIKTRKTAGKRIANFIGYLTIGGIFTYPKRCPNCGKDLDIDKVAVLIYVDGILIIAIIVIVIVVVAKGGDFKLY